MQATMFDTEPQTTAMHPFERSGNGKAPFRYVGMIHQEISYGERVIGSVGGIAVTTKPGGTCDHCGTYIVAMFAVESSDGKRFKVGCDCILKVDAVAPIRNAAKFAADRKAAKLWNEQSRIAAAVAALATDPWGLTSKPHPIAWRAAHGDTMADWCRWMFANSGHAGKIRTARVVEAATARAADTN